jgi:para-nitrobenzyl esterase
VSWWASSARTGATYGGAFPSRAPQPAEPWTGTLEALEHGSPCPQFASPFGGTEGRPGTPAGDEDCLYLNVYAPRVALREVPRGGGRLPVMVWIHGGGNVVGHGGFYDGGNLAASQGVVVITVNYRLGPLGWFRHAALRGEGMSEADRSGNFGTLDLVRALEWVREHITAFGGDPGNVTIFGESAGARDVFTLMLSPQAEGLFHRAIAQSGGTELSDVAWAENFADDPEPGHEASSNETLLRLLVADGSAADRAQAKARLGGMSHDDVESYLRGKSAFELLDVYGTEEQEALIDLPKVFADGFVLPTEDPLDRFATAGGYNQVPVMLGTNLDENKLFMFFQPRWVRRILWIFPQVLDEGRYNVTAEYLSKMWKATGADGPAAALRQTQGPSVYVYRFDWDEEPTRLGADLSMMLGAAHGFEIPFVFGHFNLGRAAPPRPADDVLLGAVRVRRGARTRAQGRSAEVGPVGSERRGRSEVHRARHAGRRRTADGERRRERGVRDRARGRGFAPRDAARSLCDLPRAGPLVAGLRRGRLSDSGQAGLRRLSLRHGRARRVTPRGSRP